MISQYVMKPCSVKISAVVAASFFLLIISGCIKDRQESQDSLRPGDKLPEFSASFSDGTSVNVPADLAGKVSCIVLFNTSCPDCRKELPVIQELYDLCPEVAILLVSREEEAPSIEKFWSEAGLSIPYSAQPDRSIYNLFATSLIPRTYIADKSGTIRYVHADDPVPSLSTLLDEVRVE